MWSCRRIVPGRMLSVLMLYTSLASAQVLTESDCRGLLFDAIRKSNDVEVEAVRTNDLTLIARFDGGVDTSELRTRMSSDLARGTLADFAAAIRITDDEIRDVVQRATMEPGDGFFDVDMDGNAGRFWFRNEDGVMRIYRVRESESDRTYNFNWNCQGKNQHQEGLRGRGQPGRYDLESGEGKYRTNKRYHIGNWADAGDLQVRIAPEIYLDSVTYAQQSPDYYLIAESVTIRNWGQHALNLEEVRLGSCAPDLVTGGYLKPITPPQPEFGYRCGIMELLRKHGVNYNDIEPGRNVRLVPGESITLAFVYSLSNPDVVRGELSFRFWAVEVLEDGDVRDNGGSTFIYRGAAR